LSKIQKFLLLDVHDALGNMEGAKSRPKLLPCEAAISGARSLETPPPSSGGIMKLMSGEENLLISITLNKPELLFNSIKPKVRIKRILGTKEDGRISAKEFPKPVDLRFIPRTLVAMVAHLIDDVPEELCLLRKNVREGMVNSRVGNAVIVVVIVIVTARTTGTILIGSRTQHHPIINE